MTMTISTATIMPRIFRVRFMSRTSCQNGKWRSSCGGNGKQNVAEQVLQLPSLSLRVLQEFGRWNRLRISLFLRAARRSLSMLTAASSSFFASSLRPMCSSTCPRT